MDQCFTYERVTVALLHILPFAAYSSLLTPFVPGLRQPFTLPRLGCEDGQSAHNKIIVSTTHNKHVTLIDWKMYNSKYHWPLPTRAGCNTKNPVHLSIPASYSSALPAAAPRHATTPCLGCALELVPTHVSVLHHAHTT